MKKLLLLFFLSSASLAAFAQSSSSNDFNVNEERLTIGIKEGLSLSELPRTVNGGGSASASPVVDLNAGVIVDYKLEKGFSIQPGLYYAGTGGNNKTVSADGSITSNTKTYLYYLQLPINLVYHIHEGYNTLYFGAGPYIGYGLRGKTTGNITTTTGGVAKEADVSETLNFGSEPSDLSRFDFGVDPLVGYQFEDGFFLNATYYLGLANIYNANTFSEQGVNSKARNSALTFSIGLAF